VGGIMKTRIVLRAGILSVFLLVNSNDPNLKAQELSETIRYCYKARGKLTTLEAGIRSEIYCRERYPDHSTYSYVLYPHFSVLEYFYSAVSFLLLLGILASRRIPVPPGACLRIVADFLFSRRTYVEILEPTLRDLFDEYCEALNQKRPWKARWVRVRGYWSVWSAVFAQLPISAVKMVYKIWKATR
jgi:hypothetical protein